MNIDTLKRLAAQIGFDYFADLNMEALIPREDVRAMCAADRCSQYGHSWSCPPACGTLTQIADRMQSYQAGLLIQSVAQLRDAFDLDTIRQCEQLHKKRFHTLARQVMQLDASCMPMASGACTICRKCTYPGRPCRYPHRMFPSMEACGLWVSDICQKSGLDYNHGLNAITYTACILIKE
jgi:predicted metal-binding protein